MINSALVGTNSIPGKYWSKKRFFDYLIDEDNTALLSSSSLAELAIICPSLWEGKYTMDRAAITAKIQQYIGILSEVRAERVTYVTGMDLLASDANEQSTAIISSDDPYIQALIELRNFINLRFGRVLTMRLGDLLGAGEGYTVLSVLKQHAKAKTLPVALLERHQFYPMFRLALDADIAWKSGLEEVNMVSEPVTTYDIVETLFPNLMDKLPVAKETDPIGSTRTSLYSFHWYDPKTGYIMDKKNLLGELKFER